MEEGEWPLVRDGVCFLGEEPEGVERTGEAVPVESFFNRLPGELFSGEWLVSFEYC